MMAIHLTPIAASHHVNLLGVAMELFGVMAEERNAISADRIRTALTLRAAPTVLRNDVETQ